MQKFGDVTAMLTQKERERLAGLPVLATEFVVAVRQMWPGAELVDVRRPEEPPEDTYTTNPDDEG